MAALLREDAAAATTAEPPSFFSRIHSIKSPHLITPFALRIFLSQMQRAQADFKSTGVAPDHLDEVNMFWLIPETRLLQYNFTRMGEGPMLSNIEPELSVRSAFLLLLLRCCCCSSACALGGCVFLVPLHTFALCWLLLLTRAYCWCVRVCWQPAQVTFAQRR